MDQRENNKNEIFEISSLTLHSVDVRGTVMKRKESVLNIRQKKQWRKEQRLKEKTVETAFIEGLVL
jgi:hypothetical protein